MREDMDEVSVRKSLLSIEGDDSRRWMTGERRSLNDIGRVREIECADGTTGDACN